MTVFSPPLGGGPGTQGPKVRRTLPKDSAKRSTSAKKSRADERLEVRADTIIQMTDETATARFRPAV